MKQMLNIPQRIQLETFYGCNAKCIMCAISLLPKRKIGPMSIEMSNYILDEFSPYINKIEKVDFFGLGEPLLDPYIFERIKYAKKKGFRSIAISTNADLLNKKKQIRLLDSEIDTVIFSIDGIKKETHENIRKNLKFERVLKNCLDTIKMRNEKNYKTRFVVRFIRQESNEDELEEYKNFWKPKLSKEKGDKLIIYDVNTMGETFSSKEELVKNIHMDIEKKPCHMVFDRFIILVDGTVSLCCEDIPNGAFNLGNVNNTPPIEIFNNEAFNSIRRVHLAGNKNNIDLCKVCTLLYSEQSQQVVEFE